jgi:hypothetical protein
MIVGPGTGKISVPDLGQVLDLSANVGADAWMADGGTNLLAAHRWKTLRNTLIAVGVFVVVAVGIIFVVNSGGGSEPVHHVAPPPADAAIKKPIVDDVPIDAPDDRDQIIALSKYGFFSITATATSTVFVDDQRIGQTPLTRLPLKPGPHTVKVVGPKNKSKIIKVTIIGGRDEDQGTIDWNQ